MRNREPSRLQELLSTDPGVIILSNLELADYRRLSLTDYSFSLFFKDCLFETKLAYFIKALSQEPDDMKVKQLLENNLNLLDIIFKEVILQSVTVTNVTPLQLVYGAGDTKMCETLAPYFEKKYGGKEAGRAEMQKQISEMKNEHVKFDFAPIVQAISDEKFNNGRDPETNKWILSPHTMAAIKKFREEFDASQPTIIDKGMQFRWETLRDLKDAYVALTAQRNNNTGYYYYRCALLEDAVFAWVFRHIPENDAQHFSQGLAYLQKKPDPQPLMRMKTMRDGRHFYTSLKEESACFLHLDSLCVDIIYGRLAVPQHYRIPCAQPTLIGVLENFCRTKMWNLQKYAGTHNAEPERGCMVV